MNIYILTIWEDGGEAMNEVSTVLFDKAAVLPKVDELLHYDGVTRVSVETWYREEDNSSAEFYEVETFWKAIKEVE